MYDLSIDSQGQSLNSKFRYRVDPERWNWTKTTINNKNCRPEPSETKTANAADEEKQMISSECLPSNLYTSVTCVLILKENIFTL